MILEVFTISLKNLWVKRGQKSTYFWFLSIKLIFLSVWINKIVLVLYRRMFWRNERLGHDFSFWNKAPRRGLKVIKKLLISYVLLQIQQFFDYFSIFGQIFVKHCNQNYRAISSLNAHTRFPTVQGMTSSVLSNYTLWSILATSNTLSTQLCIHPAVFFSGKKIGDTINETEFVKVLSKKIQGNITLTSGETEEHSLEYKSAGIVTKVIAISWRK